MIKLNDINFGMLYSITKEAFQECISLEDNDFLKNEVNFPLDSIVTKEDFISIKFWEYSTKEFIIEIKLILLDQKGEKIGRYHYLIDEKNEVVDDILVFD